MVNCLYAVLSHVISNVSPQISLSSFIDDCKIWGAAKFEAQLVAAFQSIQDFDETIGQKIQIFTRRAKKAKQF